jgi:hypothetical protein
MQVRLRDATTSFMTTTCALSFLFALLLSAGVGGALGQEPTAPSVDETLSYLNAKLKSFPSSHFPTNCTYPDPAIELASGGTRLEIHQVVRHSCTVSSASLPIFQLGSSRGDNRSFSTGDVARVESDSVVMFVCRDRTECFREYFSLSDPEENFKLGYALYGNTIWPVEGYALWMYGDDESIARIGRAVRHLIALLQQQAKPAQADPFAKQ